MEGLLQLSQPLSRADLAVDAIRAAILGGVIAPGEQLVERTLAAKLGVSKTPVREALRSLESSGLLESHPVRGVVVRRVDAKLVADLYEFRLLVEPTAVKLAVPHHDARLIERVRATLSEAHRLGEQQDLPELSGINRSFHEMLYERCPNELLRSGLDGMRDQLALVAASGWRAEPSWDLERQEHLEILEAVAAHGADLAGKLTYLHIEHARARLLATME